MRFRRQLGNRIFTSACAHSVYFSEDTERYEYSTAAAALDGRRLALHTPSNVRRPRTLRRMSFSDQPRHEMLVGVKRLPDSHYNLQIDCQGGDNRSHLLQLWIH